MAEEENKKEGEEKEEESEEESSDNSKAEDKKEKKVDAIEEAKGILEQMTEQNKVFAENIKEAKKAGADLMLSGRAPAGREKSKEEITEDSARKLVEGTGLERMAGFKPKK